MEFLKGILVAAESITTLNGGAGTNEEEYTVLKTKETKVESWWDGLDWGEKIDVGSVAIHYHKMSANYKWNCRNTPYSGLTKSQQKIIDWIFVRRFEKFQRFYLNGMLK